MRSSSLILLAPTVLSNGVLVDTDGSGTYGYGQYWDGFSFIQYGGLVSTVFFYGTTWSFVNAGGSWDFTVTIFGNYSQNAVTLFEAIGSSGVRRSFYTASASAFASGSGTTFWGFGAGASPVWAAGDVGLTRAVYARI